jgi:large subunit ribosomal protein L10
VKNLKAAEDLKKNTEEKQQVVDDLVDKFKRSNLAILTDYRGEEKGLTVEEVNILRKSFRAKGGEFKVVKNTLIKRALDEMKIEGLDDQLFNPTAILFSFQDPAAVSKALVDFAKTKKSVTNVNGVPIIKMGYLEGKLLNPDRIRELALLPSKEVMLARLAGTLQAPISKLVRTLAEPMAKLVRLLPQIKQA